MKRQEWLNDEKLNGSPDLYAIVFDWIERHPGLSIAQLAWHLNRKYGDIETVKVDMAVYVLRQASVVVVDNPKGGPRGGRTWRTVKGSNLPKNSILEKIKKERGKMIFNSNRSRWF